MVIMKSASQDSWLYRYKKDPLPPVPLDHFISYDSPGENFMGAAGGTSLACSALGGVSAACCGAGIADIALVTMLAGTAGLVLGGLGWALFHDPTPRLRFPTREP